MQIIDFEALRLRAETRRRSRFTVLSARDGENGDIIRLPSAARRWAAEQMVGLMPEPDPGPSAA